MSGPCQTTQALDSPWKEGRSPSPDAFEEPADSPLDALVAAGPLLVAELELTDLARGGHRKLVHQFHLGYLVSGDTPAQEVPQLVGLRLLTRLESDERLRPLAPALVRIPITAASSTAG